MCHRHAMSTTVQLPKLTLKNNPIKLLTSKRNIHASNSTQRTPRYGSTTVWREFMTRSPSSISGFSSWTSHTQSISSNKESRPWYILHTSIQSYQHESSPFLSLTCPTFQIKPAAYRRIWILKQKLSQLQRRLTWACPFRIRLSLNRMLYHSV
jgi:hypothetical protein